MREAAPALKVRIKHMTAPYTHRLELKTKKLGAKTQQCFIGHRFTTSLMC